MDKQERMPSGGGSGIVFSVYESRHAAVEQCVALHGISYILSGRLRVLDSGESRDFGAGSLVFCPKNLLAKFTKIPPDDASFRSITILFDNSVLQAFSQQYGVYGEQSYTNNPIVQSLAPGLLLHNFFAALEPYFDLPLPLPLAHLKGQEALLLLQQLHPSLQSVLFNFSQPGKIDLETFMQQNFRFNVELKQWAYLTGRSLASFKRNFNRVFQMSPGRWLYRKRLEEAFYLLKVKGRRPSQVYHEVGFESLAHFSYAFKKIYGQSPSSITMDATG
ncbi:AraC family transcriptional regulator [Spirosoma aerophilum]